MTIQGTYRLEYDWDSKGNYNTEIITFQTDGSWTSGEAATGRWAAIEGMFFFNFTGAATTYAGLLASSAVTGNMTNFSGEGGSWFMVKEGVTLAAVHRRDGIRNLAGDIRKR